MAPLIQGLLAALPSLTKAVKVLTDKDERDDNAKSETTDLAKLAGVATGGAAAVVYGLPILGIDPGMEPKDVGIMLLISVGLYFYRRRGTKQ